MQSIPLSRAAAAPWRARLSSALPTRAMVLLGLALAGAVLADEWWRNLRLDAFLDHIEGNVVIGGWLWSKGEALYALQGGYAQFSNIYGPLAYLSALPGLWLAGPSVIAGKLPAAAALVATLGLTAWRWRREAAMPAAHAMFLLVAGFAALSPMSFWTRADPFEALLATIALAAAASPLAVGVCIGLAVNFKIHAFLYFLPILWELWTRRGWRAAPVVAAASFATFLAPFLLPGISLHDYLATLAQQIGGRSRSNELLAPVAAYGIALALPVLLPLCRRGLPSTDRHYGIAALASLALVAFPATFPGAGPYHFLPLLPVLAEARRRLAPQGIGGQFAVFPLLFFAAATTRLCLGDIAERQDWHAYAAEALALAREAPPGAVVDIGYGDNKRSYQIAQLAKAELSRNSYPRQVDAQILMELAKTGIDGSARWIPYLTECRVGRWIMPRGETPFAVRSYFYDDAMLFDDAFRTAFAAHYRPVTDSAHFTVWTCAHD